MDFSTSSPKPMRSFKLGINYGLSLTRSSKPIFSTMNDYTGDDTTIFSFMMIASYHGLQHKYQGTK